MASKTEIRNIQIKQVDEMEEKLRFIAENVEELIIQLRIKQAEELKNYADAETNQQIMSLWRGQSIESYVICFNTYNNARKDMERRLELPVFDQLPNDNLFPTKEEIDNGDFDNPKKHVSEKVITSDLIGLTKLERKVMKYLKDDRGWYNWGSEPTFSDVFSEELSEIVDIDNKSLRGVLASLVKKQLISVHNMGYHDAFPEHKEVHIIYPTFQTYVLYEEVDDYVKKCFGVDIE